ncbi:hypothetical protein NEIPOLOT_01668 [Neisseria polysaccharea ATCC 43768]|nr:hypothetical protein NEIPOLOT_01668 [Neisseria polysaccharea ATCC 43768]
MGKPYGWDFCEEANDAIQEAIREDNERRDKEDIYYPEWIFPIEEAQSYCLKIILPFVFTAITRGDWKAAAIFS